MRFYSSDTTLIFTMILWFTEIFFSVLNAMFLKQRTLKEYTMMN